MEKKLETEKTETNAVEIKQESEYPNKVNYVQKGYYCDICARPFKNSMLLAKHKKNHDARERIPCTDCGKTFKSAQTLREHQAFHKTDGEPTFECTECKKAYFRSKDLGEHKRKTHGTNVLHISCAECGKIFSNNSKLKAHQVVVHKAEDTDDAKVYYCENCHKIFDRMDSLNRHIMSHTGEKNHNCKICGKLFSQPWHLKGHMSVHSDEKSLSCDICFKNYKTQSSLNRHKRVTHEKNDGGENQCQECGYTCNEEIKLTEHLIRHSLESHNIELMAMLGGMGQSIE